MFRSPAQTTFAPPHQPEYDHTQRAPLYLLILAPGFFALLLAAAFSQSPEAVFVSLLTSAVLAGAALSFRSLRVVDEGDALAIRFGPLPLFRKRIPYTDIAGAQPDRSSFIDGWGIHWVPGRGWTYNLWGYDCVRLTITRGRTVRIGTDDPDGLARFLNQRLSK